MLTTTFQLDSPLLKEALKEVPDAQATVEGYYKHGETLRLLFWVTGGAATCFERACRADPTVTEPSLITEADDKRFYQVDYTERGIQLATFPFWSELNLVLFDLQGTHGNWQFHMGFPDHETFLRYQQLCDDRDLHLDLQTISSQPRRTRGDRENLTTRQREALATAFREGYYEVPRDISLTELAEKLGISRQATSERLRRGTATLLHDSLVDG